MKVKNILFLVAVVTMALLLAAFQAGGSKEKTGEMRKDNEFPRAVFAGGCFWCMESEFEKTPGVIEVISGYTGGHSENPTYEEVSSGKTGHMEAVEVFYDPDRISYEELLDIYWRHIDPTDSGGQFVDRGSQYRTAIFYETEKQRELAERSKRKLEASGQFKESAKTRILKLSKFFRAEGYHQDYYKKNPSHYELYRLGSGRDKFLEKVWGWGTQSGGAGLSHKSYRKPDDESLRRKLTPLEYEITQQEGTEHPFDNEYWDNKRDGIYVDIVSGEPLFSSLDKFDSGTGWPSFSKPLESGNIVEKEDRKFFTVRTEVRSKHADSHLGHVFPDGPPPTGLRYCINSAALKFIPKEQLEKEGYGNYLYLFDK